MIKRIGAIALVLLFLGWIYFPSYADRELSRAMEIKKKHPDQKIFDGFLEPDIPKESDTLLGVDANANGVRDDIEIWINRTWKSYNERMAVRQYASDLQYNLIAGNENNRDLISHAASSEFTSLACMRFIFGFDEKYKLIRKIQLIVYNTKKRKDALDGFDNFSYGYSYIVKDMKINEEYKGCRFKIQNEIELKKVYLKE